MRYKYTNLYEVIWEIYLPDIKIYLFFVLFLSINPDKGSAIIEFP